MAGYGLVSGRGLLNLGLGLLNLGLGRLRPLLTVPPAQQTRRAVRIGKPPGRRGNGHVGQIRAKAISCEWGQPTESRFCRQIATHSGHVSGGGVGVDSPRTIVRTPQ